MLGQIPANFSASSHIPCELVYRTAQPARRSLSGDGRRALPDGPLPLQPPQGCGGIVPVGIKVALQHRTRYVFDRLVEVYPHVVRLRPAPHTRTAIEAYSMDVEPAGHFVNWQQDAFGNFMARLVFPERARELSITVGLIADLKVINPFDFFVEDFAETFPFSYPVGLADDLDPYLRAATTATTGPDPASGCGTGCASFP